MVRSKQRLSTKILLLTSMSLMQSPAYCAAMPSGQSSDKTELRLHDRLLATPEDQSYLLDLALEAALRGDRHQLAKMYRLSLLSEQNSASDKFHSTLAASLLTTHESAKDCYRNGNVSEAIERIRLFFNLVTQLSKRDCIQNTEEVEEWLAASKILGLPKEDCIGMLNDYGFLLNCSGQYKLAIPVLKAVTREAPDRAVAFLSLGDAEYYSGKRTDATNDYATYRRLKAEHKYGTQTSLSNACLTPTERNGSKLSPQGTDPFRPDMVAVLSTKGRLIDAGTVAPSKPNPESVASNQIQATAINSGNALPWLEDFYKENKPKSQIALTDATAHSKTLRQTSHRGILPSPMQSSLELNDDAILALQDRVPKDAIMSLNQALEADPGCLLTLENLAVAYNNMAIDSSDQPKAALKSFRQALAIAPASGVVRANTNAMLIRMGKNPTSFETRLSLARECLERADYLGALVEYREAERLKGDPHIREMIAAVTQQIAIDEVLPRPQISAALDWKNAVEAGRIARNSFSLNP